MEYVDYPNVELISVGMEWHGMNGDMHFTLEHLADAVAAQADTHIKAPRIKIGHDDPRFNDGSDDYNPFSYGDGEPALGVVKNLRLENDGAVIMGDFVNVPKWLADALPSAYPNRSIEGAYMDGGWDVTTPGGKHYSFVLTACALLGIYLPAVQDLEDLEVFLTEGPQGEDVTIQGVSTSAVPVAGATTTITAGDVAKVTVAAGSPDGPVAASADIDKVKTTFWNEFATEDTGRYWWWPRSVWTDPNEIIADDDEGSLWRVPFTSDTEGNVTFGDPTEVRQTFVDVTTNQPVAARQGAPKAAFKSRADAGRNETKAASRPEQETDMDAKFRELLGLAEDATDEEAVAKLEEIKAANSDDNSGDVVAEVEETEEAEAELEPVAASADTTVAIDKGVLEDLQRQAQEGAAARSEQLNVDRERKLSDAVSAGKIAPSSKDAWRSQLKTAPEATAKVLDELPAGLIPVEENGKTEGVASNDQYARVMASFGITNPVAGSDQ